MLWSIGRRVGPDGAAIRPSSIAVRRTDEAGQRPADAMSSVDGDVVFVAGVWKEGCASTPTLESAIPRRPALEQRSRRDGAARFASRAAKIRSGELPRSPTVGRARAAIDAIAAAKLRGERSVTVLSFRAESALDGAVQATEVHKRHVENVWLDSARAVSAYTVGAVFKVPTDTAGHGRLVELIEVQRQVGMLQLARRTELPDSDVFILNRLSLRLLGRAKAPVQGTVYSHLVSSAATGQNKRNFHQRFVFEARDGVVAAGRSHATFLPRTLYLRLRATANLHADPVKAGATGHEPLVLNVNDPVLLDHGSDHVTAMQIIVGIEEALRRRDPRGELTAIRLSFDNYIELSPRPMLAIAAGARGRFSGQVRQNGVARASFVASVAQADVVGPA